MKKFYIIIILLLFTFSAFSQSGRIDLKYPTVVPSLRVGGTTKVRLDSIVSNVDTVKFYTGGTELKTKAAGTWTGTGVGLDTTLAKVTLEIDQVTNESKSTMFNNSSFTGSVRFNDGLYPGLTDLVRQIGTVDNEWNRFYLSTNGYITWNNSIFLTGDAGQIYLNGGNLSLGSNNLLMTGSLGATSSRLTKGWFADLEVTNQIVGSITGNSATVSNYTPAGGSITLSGADAITFTTTGASSLTLPTSGTLLTTAVLSGYAPLDGAALTGDLTVEYIRPATSTGVVLGHPSYPWANLYMSSTAGVVWDASTNIILAPVFGTLRLENSPLLIMDNDLGTNLERIRKGYFTDLDITNRPTVSASPIATTQDINDSITEYLNNATLGVALADSNLYNGGYATRTFVESLLGSGEGMTTQRLPFIIGTTAGAPPNADTIVTHTAFSGKHIDIYRDGAKQYQNYTATNTIDGFRVVGSDVIVKPAWATGEQVIIDITEPIFWSSLAFEGEESTLLTGLSGYWKLDETSGTTVTDATGTQNGTRSSSVGVGIAGKLGYANTFNVSTDYINIPYNTNISPKGTSFSVAAWIKLDSLPSVVGHESYIFQQNVGASPWAAHWVHVDDSDNKLTAATRNTTNTAYYVRSTDALSVDTWYHVVFVNPGNGQDLILYVNGVDVSDTPATFSGTILEGLDNTNFGTSYTLSTTIFEGTIDSPAIWSRALTSGEVTSLYNLGNGRTHPFN